MFKQCWEDIRLSSVLQAATFGYKTASSPRGFTSDLGVQAPVGSFDPAEFAAGLQ
jgi:hypothetical protein